ncbi:MAG: hypothetical protein WD646_02425 [Actinomycetota bacterium]
MTRRRVALALSVAAPVLLSAQPALAHGVGGRADLPLPLNLVAYSAGGVLVVSFAALAWLWPRTRWQQTPVGRPFPAWLDRVVRIGAWPARLVALAIFGVTAAAAYAGDTDIQRNFAPLAVYVVLWVGLFFFSPILGNLWRAVGPIDTLARPIRRERKEYRLGHWPAAAFIFGFTWLELVYPDAAEPRVLALAMTSYVVVVLAGAAVWGRPWMREGEGFGALFGLLAAMAPVYRDESGRFRIRAPLVGLTGMKTRPGTVALVFTALGSTTYDGLSRTAFYQSIVGDVSNLFIGTAGLAWTIAAVYALYRVAVSMIPGLAGVAAEERDTEATAAAFVHSLMPIVLAYAVAHYFSLLVFEGQTALALASDPLGRGWDLFGTAEWQISYSALSTRTIAYVQVGVVVLGHVAGVVLAHDRAVSRFPLKAATRSQYPLLAVMVVYTVGALVILLGG